MKLCLNMIVKNEAANLERCLRSVADHVSCWVIGDTGSTDGTQELIRSFFQARGIAGELHEFPFETFSQARNRALDLARASSLAFDYLLLTDADMELVVGDRGFADRLSADAYQLRQNSGIVYWNTRLLRREADARYVGVTHEYLDLRGGETLQLEGADFIDHASGANRAGKFSRDAALLSRALETETDPGLRARYTFYLANSLRDDGDRPGALAQYLARAQLGHWAEEVFVSLLNAAELKRSLGHEPEEVLATFEAATTACPTRAEALHCAARFCRDTSLHARGADYAARGMAIPMPRSGLFVSEWIYAYGLLDEFAVCAYWAGRHAESLDACDRLLASASLPEGERARVARNRQFAADRLREAGTTVDDRVVTEASAAALSTWVPDRPLAGTELMTEGVRQRLHGELDAINLCVNLFDPASEDPRPLVVWIHHDVNQAAVKWCRDAAVVAKVARFVFISHWQRERFQSTFGLEPERCVVIRHAFDQTSDYRVWTAAPVLRCAYTSTPFRGLDVLLDAWDRLPKGRAELHIWSSMKLYTFDDRPYQHLFERARTTPGIVYHGLAPNPQLRAALRDIHILSYPSTFAETACLSVMEAMAAGCRVVVPAYGALPETTGGYARLYPWCADHERHVQAFAETLADEIDRPWRGRPEGALAQQAHCTSVYAWSRCIAEWRELLGSLSGAHSVMTPTADVGQAPTNVVAAPSSSRIADCLQRLREKGFDPRSVIDVGAYQGDFSRMARAIFPNARILMLDALAEMQPPLEAVCRHLGNADVAIALIGEADVAEVPFFVVDTVARPDLVKTGSSKFRENSSFGMDERRIPQRRLGDILDDLDLSCELLKLDVQGAELDCLRGLGSRLDQVDVIALETSVVEYNRGGPLFAQVLGALDTMGFVLFEIVEEHRYRDGSLMQLDGVFVRKDSPFRHNGPFWS